MALGEMRFTKNVLLNFLRSRFVKARHAQAADHRIGVEGGDPQWKMAAPGDWTIVMFATGGLASLVENALVGIRRCGLDPRIVQLVCPRAVAHELGPVVERYGTRLRVLEEMIDVDSAHMPSSYVDWNTDEFNLLMSYRFPVLRIILAEGKNVIASDIDVAWLRNPLPYLSDVLQRYPWACQVEPTAEFPPNFCLGFFAVRATPETTDLIDRHIAILAATKVKPADQIVFREMLIDEPRFLAEVFPLPESIFPTGLLYRSVLNDESTAPVVDRTEPFIFHANWCVGLQNKQKLLEHVGAWFVAPKGATAERPRKLRRGRLAFLNWATGHKVTECIIELNESGLHSYTVPAGTTRLRIVSDVAFFPPDPRKLGAAITRITLDDVLLYLSDASLMTGFHAVEREGETIWRWTNGSALVALPLKSSRSQIDIEARSIAAKMRP
jgi:hypothetical protein